MIFVYSRLAEIITNNYLQVAKTFLSGKATLVSVGDVFQLPYAEDLGLTV
jgi:ubiquinol-cytochrome c reductase core subunit 2